MKIEQVNRRIQKLKQAETKLLYELADGIFEDRTKLTFQIFQICEYIIRLQQIAKEMKKK